MSENLNARMIMDEIKCLSRRVSDLQRQVETLDQDREILESLQRAVRSLEEAFNLHKSHDETLFKDIKLEVQTQGQRTEEQVKKVGTKVAEHVGDLVENISAKEVVVIKETLIQRIKKMFKRKQVKK